MQAPPIGRHAMMNDRPAHWLDAERLRNYPRIFVALYLLLGVIWVATASHGIDPLGKPIGYDFITFWAASKLALNGQAAAAFDPATIQLAEQLAVPGLPSVFLWHYPPPFYLLVMPLSLLPYLVAYGLFVAVTLALFIWPMRRIFDGERGGWLLAAFPAMMVNVFHGQNGFLTAALMSGGLLLLSSRPWLAGVLLGSLAIKPHLAVLLPLALAVGGQWRAFAAAALAAVLWMGLSVAVLGTEVLQRFVDNLPLLRAILEAGYLPWSKMPTMFASLSLLGAPASLAYLAQAALALPSAWAVAWVWRRTTALSLRGSALMAGSLLISPYLFDYDLVWLAPPLAWLGVEGCRHGWLRGERELLFAVWLSPLLGSPLGEYAHLQLMPLLTAALLALIVVRTRIATAAMPPAAVPADARSRP